MHSKIERFFCILLTAFSLVGAGVSYWYQYIQGLTPCTLCLVQRYLLLAIAFIGLAVFVWRRKGLAALQYTLLAALLSVSAYHLGVTHGVFRDVCRISKSANVEEYKQMLFTRKKSCAHPQRLFGLSLPAWNLTVYGLLALLFCGLKKRFPAALAMLAATNSLCAEGVMVNPINDICWECLFPITVSGVNLTGEKQTQENDRTRLMVCPGVPPKPCLPVTLWEPCKLVDVTRHAYKLLGLGGVTIGKESIRNRGTIGGEKHSKHSFYQVHVYSYPVFELLNLCTDFDCIDHSAIATQYLSELDPTWRDESLSLLQNAEAAFFNNKASQAVCALDCMRSNSNQPIDKLFWCAGCEGSLYPFTGNVSHHEGGIQASALLLHRVIAKLHRLYLLKGYEDGEYCEQKPMPIIKKSLYKTQLVYPVAQRKGKCHALGKSDVLWGSGKSYPKKGEDFVYMLWVKKHCCIKPVTPEDVLRSFE